MCSSETIGIVERVVLVVEFDDRARQLRAFLDAEARGERAGGDVAHDDLERDDLDLADELLAHVQPADEVRGNADVVEVLEDVLGNPVVQHALAVDHFMLLGVEGGRVVLEMLDQRSGLGAFIEDLGLAFVDATAAVHRRVPCFEEIHGTAVAHLRENVRERAGDNGSIRRRSGCRLRRQPTRSGG